MLLYDTVKNVVVIGGGTGTFVTLSALKKIPGLDISAIVTVADSGGSTGRLRDEFGFLAVGDLRQALAALAQENGQTWIRELLLYRFSKGSGLEGHNLGNLILTALQDMTGSTAKAVEIASSIFRLHGHIYPVTTQNVQLVIEYEDGTVEIGEHRLDDAVKHGGDRIVNVRISPRASIYEKAKRAILSADIAIVGPGDLYSSILANFVVDGATEAIKRSKARLIVMMNLMTRFTETHNMTATDQLTVLERHFGRPADVVIVNKGKIPTTILEAYRKQREYPVKDTLTEYRDRPHIVRADLVRTAMAKQQKGDKLVRSYLRHDPAKLAAVFKEFLP